MVPSTAIQFLVAPKNGESHFEYNGRKSSIFDLITFGWQQRVRLPVTLARLYLIAFRDVGNNVLELAVAEHTHVHVLHTYYLRTK